ncbi:Succinate dehydrogenase assembly factor 4, mitochondrial [Hypsizygus marmoreus]|uniref:Succinate dehydrogenase assembly factor 4, mitochondrial n=1 Tax=Hypsizygus marmoreus TaxID=39966 RepID=A0A369JUB0_HYPMA|nr:Succinate dehydrogenase assembly factor 4, mitochondrial [Hypsizygus marmoreus]
MVYIPRTLLGPPSDRFISQKMLQAVGIRRSVAVLSFRRMASTNLNRPAPPPLPREQQREFEELQRKAQTPLAPSNVPSNAQVEAELAMHPDARKPVKPEFDGDVNPITGEEGGPKQEPVRKWGEDPGGDWSFKGRVTDF